MKIAHYCTQSTYILFGHLPLGSFYLVLKMLEIFCRIINLIGINCVVTGIKQLNLWIVMSPIVNSIYVYMELYFTPFVVVI